MLIFEITSREHVAAIEEERARLPTDRTGMSRKQFRAEMIEAERLIRERVFSPRLLFFVGFGVLLGMPTIPLIAWAENGYWVAEFWAPTLGFLGGAAAVFVGCLLFGRANWKRYARLAAKCPHCQALLVFLSTDEVAWTTMETGRCYCCHRQVF